MACPGIRLMVWKPEYTVTSTVDTSAEEMCEQDAFMHDKPWFRAAETRVTLWCG